MKHQSWRMSPMDSVDKWERPIRDWMERQGKTQPDGWDKPEGSILWHFSALFLHRAVRVACIRVHRFMTKLYRKIQKKDDAWLTFEQTMGQDRLSEWGACMLTLWLLDCLVPAEVRLMVGLAEAVDGSEVVPVVIVMEAGLMVVDPTRKVTGRYPKQLAKIKKYAVQRCFDVSGSFSLTSVVHPMSDN